MVLYSQVLSSEFIDKLLEILREENALLKTHISEYETVISKKEEKILILEDQLLKLRNLIHGVKSEKHREIEKTVSQLKLLFNEAEGILEDKVTPPPEEEEFNISPIKKKRDRKIMDLPNNIPTQEIQLDISPEKQICPCGSKLTRIGEEMSEKLEYIPARVKKIKLIRAKYVCKKCDTPPLLADIKRYPIQKGIATASLLSHTLTSKYCDHLPLYRQAQIWERSNINLDRQTLSRWVIQTSEILSPLIKHLKKDILDSSYVCSDETTVKVLESEKSKCYMWVHLSGKRDKRAIVFEYQDNRSQESPLSFLEGFVGFHQSDAYSGYNALHRKEGVIFAGCWDHARRRFVEIVKLSKEKGVAYTAVKMINQLYKIERHAIDEKLPPDKIKILRKEKSSPILFKLKEYLESIEPGTEVLRNAINYTLNNWESLKKYIENGNVRISNADTERIIKAFAIGRKNWLFCNTTTGAKSSAIIYSIIETCKAANINPFNYIKAVLERIHEYKHRENELVELMPYNIDKKLLDG